MGRDRDGHSVEMGEGCDRERVEMRRGARQRWGEV
jgi:hypothetical protein